MKFYATQEGAMMSHERCPQWDSVTLAISLVTAARW